MSDFTGSQFEREIRLWGVRWYVAYPISYRQLDELRQERGVAGDQSPLTRWGIKDAPAAEKQVRRGQGPVGKSGRREETYVKIKGKGASLSRAVAQAGPPREFLLTPPRERAAAAAFWYQAMRARGLPETSTIAPSGSTTAASPPSNQVHQTASVSRHSQYRNTLVAHDQRAGTRLPPPLLGCNSVWAACWTIAGSEVRQALRKGQLATPENARHTPAEQFSALAA